MTPFDPGVNMPEALAAGLEQKFGGKLSLYTQSIWNLMVPLDETAVQTPNPDWVLIYKSIITP